MPLPISDTKNVWPPKDMTNIFAHMTQWSAWYSNDLSKLQIAYGGGITADSTGFFASDTGGFKPTIGQRLQRFFVGQQIIGVNRNTKLPVPIARMVCQAIADLMYADPPTFTVRVDTDNDGDGVPKAVANPTQERLNFLADDSMYTLLAQSAEIGAALGGSYLRVVWDKSVVPDRPFLDMVDADQALPEFRWGRLVAVTFWTVVAREGSVVWRHLERHELNSAGNGVIIHGLYEGEDDRLGTKMPLDARPETTAYATMTIDPATGNPISAVVGQIESDSPGLCVEYMPNEGVSGLFRSDPVGRFLGRSSLDGIEHLMDQLAETMSDWMRARRAAKARVWYDKSLLGNPGPGQGQVADLDQEIYVGASDPIKGPNVKMSDKLQVLQPVYAPAGYEATANMLIETILQMAGFTTQTFGIGATSSRSIESTATEVEARERRTFLTRGRQIRSSIPRLSRILTKLLAVDRVVFGTPNVDAPIWVDFPDSVQESPLKLAQTALTLFTSQSASLDERVKGLHPGWNDDMWDEEAAKVQKEFAPSVVDPFALPAEAPKPPDPGSTGTKYVPGGM